MQVEYDNFSQSTNYVAIAGTNQILLTGYFDYPHSQALPAKEGESLGMRL